MSARLVGHISRDAPGRPFHLAVDRGLASGKLDVVELDEVALLKLAADATRALQLLARERP